MKDARNIAILLFDDAELLDFCGPYEVFTSANGQNRERAFNVYTVAENMRITARNGLSVNVDYPLDKCPPADILVVPGGIGARTQLKNEDVVTWIKQTSDHCELVLSVCTGALLLGKADLLNGLQITTHHSAFDSLRQLVPTATVDEECRFKDNGRIITSAGIAAGIDMSLHVVERLLGADVAKKTARYMEYPWKENA